MSSKNKDEEQSHEETRSRVSASHKSRSSTRTSVSAAATRARAKAEAAKIKVSFAEKEAAMMKEKASIEARLHVLKQEKEATAASKEAAIFEEAAAELENIENDSLSELKKLTVDDPKIRTRDYIETQQFDTQAPQELENVVPHLPVLHEVTLQTRTLSEKALGSHHESLSRENEPRTFKRERFEPPPGPKAFLPQQKYSPVAPGYQREHTAMHPASPPTQCHKYSTFTPQTPDLAHYLMRREMVTSGLLAFDDSPENYWAWKASFLAATRELNLSHQEELNLLVKWLGPESSAQAKRIRSVHVNNPRAGVFMVWERLEEIYGSPEVIENALMRKLDCFPTISNKDTTKLRELSDLLRELEAAKNEGFLPGLMYLDTARGVNPIVEKLPFSLRERWITQGSMYKENYRVPFPPFSFFVDFVCTQARTRNDPSFAFNAFPTSTQCSVEKTQKYFAKSAVTVRKTDVTSENSNTHNPVKEEPDKQCPIHNKPHPLSKCRGFRGKHFDERKAYLHEHSICFRCCASTNHIAKDCKTKLKCIECESEKHTSAMHPGPAPWSFGGQAQHSSEVKQSGETEDVTPPMVTSKCTEICGGPPNPRSCSKICLVKVFHADHPSKSHRVYAVLDEQSNRSLVKSEFFSLLDINSSSLPYTLKTCSGTIETAGRKASNIIVESLDEKIKVKLPTLLECNHLPDDRSEIPTPECAQYFPHLRPIADKIPPLDSRAPILMLLGRDILSLHKVREQRNGPHNSPYAQRLDLGWVIVGELCLSGAHMTEGVNVYKTHVLQNGRPSFLKPCTNNIHVKEKGKGPVHQPVGIFQETVKDGLGESVFQRTSEDDKPAMSVDDSEFLRIMEKEMYMDDENHWVAPLPFRTPRNPLPNNREQASQRFSSLQRSFIKRPEMKQHYFDFMEKVIVNQQAEKAPQLKPGQECWYLPTFGVYHPQKPGKIRVVFDSSAKYKGISLNDVLLSGPNLNNTLIGVLLRFRKEQIAVTADVEKMFYGFKVREDHRNYLRFLWYKDNNPNEEVVDYWMSVHVFGNSPSPAVATYGLRKAAEYGELEHGTDAKQFVFRNFYVDDALTSLATHDEAIDLLQRTRAMLAESNIKLHKIASNNTRVMEAFSTEERASDLKDLDLGADPLPLQRSLGLSWALQSDSFTFRVSREVKPFTRRGTLSTVNSVYDPLGFASPITIQGKALVRDISSEQYEWDTPLPAEKETQWKAWTDSLVALEQVCIPRAYIPISLSCTERMELCIFADASTVAIAAVAYLRALDLDGKWHVGFVMGKSKLAPYPMHTVPRLELCAAVLAVELAEAVQSEIDIELQAVRFFTDSRVVLGYIHNSSRRFYTYVANRVARIRRSTDPKQWQYVSTDQNPADQGTRPIQAVFLSSSSWLLGPPFLSQLHASKDDEDKTFELVNPDKDKNIRPQVTSLVTNVRELPLGSSRFEHFSTWKSLVRGLTTLIHVAKTFSNTESDGCKGWHQCNQLLNTERSQAKMVIFKAVQEEMYKEELESLTQKSQVCSQSSLMKLDPFIDGKGLMRVGGRIRQADLEDLEKHPLILPANHHVTTLLVRHYHNKVAHQGRHFTEGALRTAGVWIVGGRRRISSIIFKCVICKRLRGKPEIQKMSDLPPDRLTVDPPFTYVGLDVFGPWSITTRRTRGGAAESKRWAVIFVCLSTRAVHLEVIETMSTSSFINAFRRFLSIRGPIKHLRSDRGTNFIGACRELHLNTDDPELKNFLKEQDCTWTFNAPHSSHMGGAWERLIGVARRILDGLLVKHGPTRLSHEVLSTLMAEVMAIINARPMVPISHDAEVPEMLSPATLLTQKASVIPAPLGNFELDHLCKVQWRQVQNLADSFWKRWRLEYLPTLQPRRKWSSEKPGLQEGDIVLIKDIQTKRNEWPLGRIVKAIASSDGKVRKVTVKTLSQGVIKEYLRPISDVVLVMSHK